MLLCCRTLPYIPYPAWPSSPAKEADMNLSLIAGLRYDLASFTMGGIKTYVPRLIYEVKEMKTLPTC